MKRSSITLPVLALGLSLSAAPHASAGNRDPGVNHRQHNQQHRMQQGARSGELTARESAHLHKEQRALRREERVYKADGNLTPRERADLHRDLNAASRDIYRQKHDAEKRAQP